MRKYVAIVIVLVASGASGFLGWLLFRRPDGIGQVYVNEAARLGLDKQWWVRVGSILEKATTPGGCKELSASDYKDLYRALPTGIPEAQQSAMLGLGNCPPVDRGMCYAKLDEVARTTQDAETQNWAFGVMWNLVPDRHDEIRREAAKSRFAGIGEEVAHWPEKLVKR